jgi:hypothetical protein
MSNTVQETSPNSTSTDLVSYPAPVYTWPTGEKPSVRRAYDAQQGGTK